MFSGPTGKRNDGNTSNYQLVGPATIRRLVAHILAHLVVAKLSPGSSVGPEAGWQCHHGCFNPKTVHDLDDLGVPPWLDGHLHIDLCGSNSSLSVWPTSVDVDPPPVDYHGAHHGGTIFNWICCLKKLQRKTWDIDINPTTWGSFPEMSELRGSATTVVRPAPRFRAVRISYTHPRSTSSKHPAAERPNSGTTGRCGAVKVAVLMVETLMWNIVGSPSLFFLQKLATHGYPKIQFLDNHPMKLALRTKSPSKSPQPHPNPRGWKKLVPKRSWPP